MAKPMTTKDKIREWISDNLRYMLLIGAILLIVVAVLLVVHLVSSKSEPKSGSGTVTNSTTNNVPDNKTQVKADSKADSEDNTNTASDASNADSSSASSSEAEPTSEPENTGNTEDTAVSFTAGNVPETSSLMEQYYSALGAKDINGLLSVTDNLTAEEQAQIEAESDVESYSDVQTYTVSGPNDGTYIAFVSSKCKYLGIDQALPMLSEYYLYTAEDGSLKIMDDTDSDASVTEAMQAALENEDVKNLITQVQNEYQNALDADASLRAYVESIQ